MRTEFTIEIELGNEAMNNHRDVAATLEHIAKRIHESSDQWPEGKIFDLNGNSVGWFGFLFVKKGEKPQCQKQQKTLSSMQRRRSTIH